MFRALRNWLNSRVVIGAILFALCLFAVLVAILWSAKPEAYTQGAATAMISVIQAPTETPILLITPTPTAEPTSSQGEPPPSSQIALGDYVQVSGTGGDGLRVHSTAGVSSEVRYVAIESEVFLVIDGPIDTDGYIWWQLKDPYNETVVGWGVSNYLSVVQTPD